MSAPAQSNIAKANPQTAEDDDMARAERQLHQPNNRKQGEAMAQPLDRADLMKDLAAGDAQCTARSKATGQRCRRASMMGSNVCRSHGGAAPQTRAKAQRRLDQAADVLVQRLLSFAIDGQVEDSTALRAIIAALDRAGFSVTNKVAVGLDADSPKPWENLFSGLGAYGGSATDAERDDTHPVLEPADVIDAEIVPDTAAEPPRGEPERPSRPMPDTERGDVPHTPKWAQYGEPPLRSKPRGELVTMEDAIAEQGRDPSMRPQRPRRVRSRRV